ncbi:DODA-type extradiol aromatic ring-opening family dioxygenase [Paludibacterium yongneupense]|uniref:DODA-type extradiol aromatic ring-opening family dioxygenase n=1 Tax=Paludibacterium yongneupense TaxID=400061 RepID=UPI0004179B5D|nr:class III extradiol ring-cleavage dioxygenase [Paludibacterium yongneupense]
MNTQSNPPPLPALFLSHGSPMMALHPGRAGAALAALGRRLPRPRAILVLSAHWCDETLRIGTQPHPAQIRDFYGFPAELSRIDYAAPGAPELAARTLHLLREAGMKAVGDDSWGLDHGSWVPLRQMYPDAGIPVTQLTLQSRQPPDYHFRLGQVLAPLAREGVLIVGSGCMTHNLRDIHRVEPEARDYARQFGEWMAARLAARDFDALFDYRRQAPHACRAHPSDEHLLPLFAALGAGHDEQLARLDGGIDLGVLCMDGFVFGSFAKEAQ